jgi:hypothetical protein
LFTSVAIKHAATLKAEEDGHASGIQYANHKLCHALLNGLQAEEAGKASEIQYTFAPEGMVFGFRHVFALKMLLDLLPVSVM